MEGIGVGMFKRILQTIAVLIIPVIFFVACAASASNDTGGGNCQDLNLQPGGSGAANDELKKMIKESKLNDWVPSELSACQGKDTEKMWYEFLLGLAKIESDGKSCGKCGDSNKSCGLFQMTGTDSCGGKNSFGGNQQATFDYKKNIECATNEWRSIMDGSTKTKGALSTEKDGSQVSTPSRKMDNGLGGSGGKHAGNAILGNPYWGPCKRSEPKCVEIIAKVNNEVCNGPGGSSSGSASAAGSSPGGSIVGSPATSQPAAYKYFFNRRQGGRY